MPLHRVVIAKIRSFGADTVIVTRIVDKEIEQVSVPGQGYVVPRYYGYYGLYYSHVYKVGYTEVEGFADAETNLHRVGDGKLIWSGRTKTEISTGVGSRPIPRYELIQGFVKLMIGRFSDDKLIR